MKTSLLRVIFGVVPVMCFVAWGIVYEAQRMGLWHRTSQESSYRPPREFYLPGNGVDSAMVLGHSRAEVRQFMGTPASTMADWDSFDQTATVVVTYTRDVATSLVVQWPEVARHERFIRRWLHLPGDGPIMVAGMKVRLETFAGDDDRLGVEALPDQEPAPAPVHSGRKPTGPASSDSLVRAFPQFPEGVRHFCKPLGHSDANVRTCQGFDAVVSYDVAPDEKPRSLTVLDPPGAKTEEECRGVLIKDRSDLMVQPEGPSHAERKVSYFTSAGVDGQSVWLEAKGFRKSPSCSVMVCDKGPAGGRTPCAP